MVRTYITALVALLALFSANFVSAFGLGEITLKSYLNQPFVAEIELIEIGDLTKDEIIPKLASPKDFANVGLQRDFFLTQLEFEVKFDEKSGRNFILVTTNTPVTEPFLDFLIEFLWPEGRLLREYTVLLDPPTYASQVAASIETVPVVALENNATTQEVTQEAAQDITSNEVAAEAEELTESEPLVGSPPMANEGSRRTITTQPKDTLWSIAARERPVNNVSVQQTMLAIQELNPEAFLHNNINYLKKNQVLRIPSENEIRSLATREALGIVADQNREWAGRTLASGGTLPVDTAKLVGSRQVTPMEEGRSSANQMKLVADTSDDGTAVGTYGGEGSGANADEAMRASRQSTQLLAEKKALKSQVETSEKLISLKDQQIAELQARLAEQGEETSTSLDSEVNNVIERIAVAEIEEEVIESEESIDSMGEEAEVAEAMAQAQSDAEAESTSELNSENAEEEISFETNNSTVEAIDSTAIESTAPVQEESNQSMLFIALGIVALLVVAGLGFFLYKRRVSSTKDDASANSFLNDGDDEGFGDIEGFDQGSELSDDAFADNLGSSSVNVLTEAETYISFNRHGQAVELLKNAIDEGDDSIAVKIKLLEAYAGVGDRGAFDALSEEVLAEDDSQQVMIDELASKMEGPSKSSFDTDATTRMNASDFDLDSNEEEFDISLDDLANDLDASFSTDNDDEDLGSLDLSEDFSEDIEVKSDSESLEDDVSFDLDDTVVIDSETSSLDLDDTVVIEAEPEDDGLELDLDDLSFDDDDENDKETSSLAEDDGLDLDLDFDLDDEQDFGSSPSTEKDLDTGLDLDASDEEDLDLDLGDELSFDEPEEDSLLESDELDLSNDLDLDDSLNLEEDSLSLEVGDDDSLFSASDDEDFELPDDGDEAATKLDLARAYIDMGDEEGAKDILTEVMSEGDAAQKAEAKELLAKL